MAEWETNPLVAAERSCADMPMLYGDSCGVCGCCCCCADFGKRLRETLQFVGEGILLIMS